VFITENHRKRTGETGSESSGILPRDKAEASCYGKIGYGWSQRNIRENRPVGCQHIRRYLKEGKRVFNVNSNRLTGFQWSRPVSRVVVWEPRQSLRFSWKPSELFSAPIPQSVCRNVLVYGLYTIRG